MIFLIPSYYNGWWKGDYYFEQKTEYVNCYSLQQNWENCKTNYILAQDETETYYNKFVIYNFFLRNNFNIFSEIDFNKEIKKDLDDFKNKFDSIPNIEIVEGQFTVVNNLTNVEKVNIINEQALITSGYLIAPNNFKIEALYLIVDNEPLSKSVHFIQTQNTSENHETIKWTFALLKEYLPDGCSKISLGGIANQEPFLVKNPIEICKK
tara:strand:- start:30 stop:656 length:627 start_codon:yes stop_codon:yes gene_type:complete